MPLSGAAEASNKWETNINKATTITTVSREKLHFYSFTDYPVLKVRNPKTYRESKREPMYVTMISLAYLKKQTTHASRTVWSFEFSAKVFFLFLAVFLSETRLHLQKWLMGPEDGLLFYNQIIISLYFQQSFLNRWKAGI